MKVSKKEYDKWVHKTFRVLQNDRNVNYTRNLNSCAMIDFETKKTVFYDSDAEDGYGSMECIVKAYSKLKGLEIPEVEEVEEIPQPWRAKKGNIYYRVAGSGNVLIYTDDRLDLDNALYNIGNYYKTKEKAEEVANKIELIFKLERLHDIYCPDFIPNFEDLEEFRCSICFNHKDDLYRFYKCISADEDINGTYFTKEAAEKVCEILNQELKEGKKNA